MNERTSDNAWVEKASIPTKCIDQTPMPIAIAPNNSQSHR